MQKTQIAAVFIIKSRDNVTEKKGEPFGLWQAAMRELAPFEEGCEVPGAA